MYTKHTGIILKKHPLGEADELVTVYTKDSGKLRAKAAGSRKIRSKLGGVLQTLNEIDFETASNTGRRFRRAKGTGLPILISARSRAVNNFLREDLNKFSLALVGAETLYRLTPDREENREIYDCFSKFLSGFRKLNLDRNWVRSFQLALLQLSGFGLDLSKAALGVKTARGDLQTLRSVQELTLTAEAERAVDRFLHTVLEREIKSQKFANLLGILN